MLQAKLSPSIVTLAEAVERHLHRGNQPTVPHPQDLREQPRMEIHMKVVIPELKKARFFMGRLLITPNAQCRLSPGEIIDALRRHIGGDWGDVCQQDREANEFALVNDLRLFSVYHTSNAEKFWIITEADRSATTILMPGDY